MARAGQVEGQKPHPRRLHLDPWTGDILVPVYHVWDLRGLARAPSKFLVLEADDIEACARMVRRRRCFSMYGVKEFLITDSEDGFAYDGGPLHAMDTTGLKFAENLRIKREREVKVGPFVERG